MSPRLGCLLGRSSLLWRELLRPPRLRRSLFPLNGTARIVRMEDDPIESTGASPAGDVSEAPVLASMESQ
eukprot:Skav203273  [mRNA]  locus=scaffold2987:131818:135310:- [translate_table: standard]